jgi:hypothetical protein
MTQPRLERGLPTEFEISLLVLVGVRCTPLGLYPIFRIKILYEGLNLNSVRMIRVVQIQTRVDDARRLYEHKDALS